MKPKRKYRKSKLTDGQREEIALEYLTTSGSYRTVGAKYGISYLQVRHCVIWHEHNELVAAATNSIMPKFQSLKNSELLQQVKRLTRQLQIARLKTEAFDTMMKLAEEDLKVQIKKKYGSRQHNASDANILL